MASIVCAGQGKIDFKPVFDQAREAGLKYAIVENERAKEGLSCARASIQHLKQL